MQADHPDACDALERWGHDDGEPIHKRVAGQSHPSFRGPFRTVSEDGPSRCGEDEALEPGPFRSHCKGCGDDRQEHDRMQVAQLVGDGRNGERQGIEKTGPPPGPRPYTRAGRSPNAEASRLNSPARPAEPRSKARLNQGNLARAGSRLRRARGLRSSRACWVRSRLWGPRRRSCPCCHGNPGARGIRSFVSGGPGRRWDAVRSVRATGLSGARAHVCPARARGRCR